MATQSIEMLQMKAYIIKFKLNNKIFELELKQNYTKGLNSLS